MLTIKDKDFLEKLKKLVSDKELRIDLKEDGVKRLVLCQNYGDKVERSFNMTRQGVRWRFQHLAEIYISSLEAIYFLESNFGTELRPMALEIAKERVALRKKTSSKGFFDAYRRQNEHKESKR
jgi:hypothetical protein